MKKYLIFASAAIFALASCTVEITPSIQNESKENTVMLSFVSERPQLDAPDAKQTKTEWNSSQNKIDWSTGDKIRVGYKLDGNWMGQSEAGTSKFYASNEVSIDGENASKGSFCVPISGSAFSDPGSSGTYQFFAVYPSSALSSPDVANPAAKNVTLPSNQTPGSNTFDKSADLLIGQSEPLSLSGLPTDPIQLSWNRVVAHADLTFSNLAFDGVEVVNQVILTFNTEAKVAGSVSLNIPAGTAGTGDDNIISLSSGFTTTSSSTEVWACLLPVTFTSLNVVIKTDKATYTRNITGISKTFKKNAKNSLTINMLTADREEKAAVNYEMFSGTIIEGDYIIYDASDGHALKAEIASDRFSFEEVTPSDDVIATNNQTIVWHIEESATAGYYTIYNAEANKYAAATGSKNQGQLLEDGTDEKCLWSVEGSFDFLNKARAASASDPANKYLRSNGSSGFACYASGTGAALTLYLHDTRSALDAPASVSAALNGSKSNAIDVTFSDNVANAVSYVIKATPAAGEPVVKNNVVHSPTTISGLAYNEEYTITVYAVPDPSDLTHKRSAVTAATSPVTTGDAPEGYVLVSSIDDVTSGLYIIAAKIGDDYIGLPNTLGTSPFAGSALTVEDGIVTTANATDYSVSITKSDNKYTIDGEDSTLGYGSSTSFSKSAEGNYALWTIEKRTLNGSFKVANVGDNTRAIVYRAGSTNKFGAYSAGNVSKGGEYHDVELFKFNGVIKSNPTTTVSPASPINLVVGDAQQLTVSSNSDGAVSYTSSDGSIATVSSDGLITAIAAGSATITVTTAATATYNQGTTPITVNVTSTTPNDGSLDHPYTVAEALAIIAGYSNKQKSAEQVYVSGIVAQVGTYNSTYHSVTYDISVDGTTSNMLNIYGGRNVGNTNFTSNSEIAVNDEVVIYGYLYLYSETKEMYQDNYISSLNGTKYLAAGSLDVSKNDALKQITVTWGAASGSNETITYTVSCGGQTLSPNPTTAGSHTFTMADYGTYTVTVVASASDASSATVSTSATLSGGTTYTVLTNGANSSKGVQNYTSSFDISDDGLTLTLQNFNNNNQGWDVVKAGSKKSKAGDPDKVTTATITTSDSIDEAIKTVTVSLSLDRGNATAKLYVASDDSFTSNLQTVDYGAVDTGDIIFTVPSAVANSYYKLEFVCTNTTTTNGVISVSQVVYTTD